MPAQCELLVQESEHKLNVDWLLLFDFKLKKIVARLMEHWAKNKVQVPATANIPEMIHVVCSMIYLYYARRMTEETSAQLDRIFKCLTSLDSARLTGYQHNSFTLVFLFTVIQIDPIITRLNLTDESRSHCRMIANEISKLQLHDSGFFLDMIDVLQVAKICKELSQSRSCVIKHRNTLFDAAKPQKRTPLQNTAAVHLTKNRSSGEFDIIDIPPTIVEEEIDEWVMLGYK